MYISKTVKQGTQPRNVHEQIAHEIGRQIAQGGFAEQDVLPTEMVLAQQYQVSRTAVREAFRILSAKGLTHSRPKIGTRVRVRSDWNMLDADVLSWHFGASIDAQLCRAVFEVRRLIEPEAAAMAALRRTERHLNAMAASVSVLQRPAIASDAREASLLAFRYAMLEASDNPFFRTIGSVTEIAHKHRSGPATGAGNSCPTGWEESLPPRYLAILAAIRDRNPVAARNEMANALDEEAAPGDVLEPCDRGGADSENGSAARRPDQIALSA